MEGATTVAADLAPNLALPWVLRLRYGMVAGEAAILLGTSYGLHLNLPLIWTLAPLGIVLASNIALGRLRVLPFRFPQETLGAIFCLDTLCLTAILGLAGRTFDGMFWPVVFLSHAVAGIRTHHRTGFIAAPGRDVDRFRDCGGVDHVFYQQDCGCAADARVRSISAAGNRLQRMRDWLRW